MSDIVYKIKQLNSVLKLSSTSTVPLNDLIKQLCEILDCNIYLFNSKGNIFSFHVSGNYFCPHNEACLENPLMPDSYMKIFENINDAIYNVYEKKPVCTCPEVNECIYSDRQYTLVPVYCNYKKKAGLLLIRYGEAFDDNEELLCEYAAVVISLELMRQDHLETERRAMAVACTTLAINSLSYSEKRAVKALMDFITGEEGVVFLSNVSSTAYVTPSTVSSAIKKLESAGVIQIKTMGVKGSFIKITNEYIKKAILEIDEVK